MPGALAGAEVRKKFGYPAACLGGNMFTGLHQERRTLRLSEEDRAILLREKGARILEPTPGRPMREYVVVPEAILASRPKLTEGLSRAQTYARTLPPRSSKGKKAALGASGSFEDLPSFSTRNERSSLIGLLGVEAVPLPSRDNAPTRVDGS